MTCQAVKPSCRKNAAFASFSKLFAELGSISHRIDSRVTTQNATFSAETSPITADVHMPRSCMTSDK